MGLHIEESECIHNFINLIHWEVLQISFWWRLFPSKSDTHSKRTYRPTSKLCSKVFLTHIDICPVSLLSDCAVFCQQCSEAQASPSAASSPCLSIKGFSFWICIKSFHGHRTTRGCTCIPAPCIPDCNVTSTSWPKVKVSFSKLCSTVFTSVLNYLNYSKFCVFLFCSDCNDKIVVFQISFI